MRIVRRLEPGTGEMASDPVRREWTFMIYLAGDNNLEEFGRTDLAETKSVGSTPEVAIVGQFDRMASGDTRRYYLRKGTSLDEDEVETHLGETNTGDPAELMRFMNWAMSEYPARHYALILWNHGMGWKEDDIYEIAQRSVGCSPVRSVANRIVRSFVTRPTRPPLFSSTVDAVMARGIAYDDTSSDFLDNAEMKRALNCSLLVTGVQKLDIVGFDACLMNMIEVAYQVRGVCDYVVGSQETEPGEGWPYGDVLRELVARPIMGGDELCEIIVDRYMASYAASQQLTQSAINLQYLGDLIDPLNEMCRYIMDHQNECELAVGRAARRTQRYADSDYKDLYDFCTLLVERTEAVELQEKCRAVMNAISPAGQDRLVLANGRRGQRLERSHGLSIYFPSHQMSPFYRRLDFASETLWDDMLLRLFAY